MSEHEQEEQHEAPPADAPVESAQVPEHEIPAGFTPQVEPRKLATPGVYWYDGDGPTIHRTLGELKPGENDFSALTSQQALMDLQDAVDGGLLEPLEPTKDAQP